MYLRLLMYLPAILIPACASSSPAFHMMYSAYKLNKQGDIFRLQNFVGRDERTGMMYLWLKADNGLYHFFKGVGWGGCVHGVGGE